MPSSDPQSTAQPSAPVNPPPAATNTESAKLTGAQLKQQAKAEKAARRAQALAEKQVSSAAPAAPPVTAPKPDGAKGPKGQQKKPVGAAATDSKGLPVRGKAPQSAAPVKVQPKEEDKTVEFFRHLYKTRRTTLAGAGKEVHPAIQALGLQIGSYTICGSCARLVATLQAFKRVIESYTTPPGNTLTRHLTSHVLSPQIEYLASCRPLSISMGNAIRWLKLEISKVDIDIPDAEAKKGLCEAIDVFIRERVTFADAVIAKSAASKIKDGDVILTYAKSSVVQKALVQAHDDGKKFKVIVVDSRPLHEGKHLAASLVDLGIDVKYCLINGLSHNIHDATKVLLGAHAMMSNGRLFSRIGTALVAMEANSADKPVLVLCETIKFTERVALDSIVHNEIAPPDELVIKNGSLAQWRDVKRLQLCNPMYDVTPAEYIHMIVTESGNVPPTSVPVLHRLGNESQG
ncbi:translation initiation factor eif-2b subunit delta [Phlyctema vagabunda]|uniref:Translation initiation factor eIF2B subunit delta n=1 Tax=Phlyctema vagabunda TaxID=108571 RepID=A0ABR4PJ16_9HELO